MPYQFGFRTGNDQNRDRMNRFSVGIAVFLLALPAFAAKGVVTNRIPGCDYYLVSTRSGYVLLKWFGGYDPHKGDTLVGAFEQFGVLKLYDETKHESTTARVEDYRLSKDKALELLAEMCE